MFKEIDRIITLYKCKKKTIKKAKSLGNNILINGEVYINYNTYLGNNVGINGLRIRENGKVTIGNNVLIANGCLIMTGNHNYEGELLPVDYTNILKDVNIEDNVWIGENVTILGGVTIGEGAIIQAGSVVVKSIPPLAIAGGNPAIPFKWRDEKHYNRLKKENKIQIFSGKKKRCINPIK